MTWDTDAPEPKAITFVMASAFEVRNAETQGNGFLVAAIGRKPPNLSSTAWKKHEKRSQDTVQPVKMGNPTQK